MKRIILALLFFYIKTSVSTCFEVDKFLIDTTIRWYKVDNHTRTPSIATHGSRSLVTWFECPGWETTPDIYGRFVDVNGEPTDSNYIRICTSQYIEHYPEIAYGGGKYCVAWVDHRNISGHSIYFTFVDTLGNVYDTLGMPIVVSNDFIHWLKVAYCDSIFLVVWEDRRITPSNIYGSRIDIDGNVLEYNGFPICTQTDWQEWPEVASNDSNFIVVWGDHRDGSYFKTYYTLVSPQGTVMPFDGIQIPSTNSYTFYPEVCASKNDYLVSWTDSSYIRLLTSRVNKYGEIVDTLPTVIIRDTMDVAREKLCFGDSLYYIIYFGYNGNNVKCQRITINNEVIDSIPKIISYSTWPSDDEAAFIYNGTNALLVWENYRSVISTASLNANGNIVDSTIITKDSVYVANEQWEPVASSDGNNFVVSWFGAWNNSSEDDIFSILLSNSGSPLDSSYIVSNSNNRDIWPLVASSGNDFFIAWNNNDSVINYGRLLDINAYPYGQIIKVCNWYAGGIAYGKDEYMVVWDNSDNTIRCSPIINGIVVDTSGKIIDYNPSCFDKPSISWGINSYLVIYCSPFGSPVYGKRIDVDGNQIDTNRIYISGLSSSMCQPFVASSDLTWLSVWIDNYNVCASRISFEGVVMDSIPINVTEPGEYRYWPRIVYDGENFVTVWYCYKPYGVVIEGAIIDKYGSVVDRFNIKHQAAEQKFPGIASDGRGKVLVVWQEETFLPYRNLRIWGALFEDPAGVEYELQKETEIISIHCYPNPAVKYINFQLNNCKKRDAILTIYNISGQTIKTISIAQNNVIKLNIENEFTAGVYLYKLTHGNQSKTGKFIVIK